jgi:hypothetical protein
VRLGHDPLACRARADVIAVNLAAALAGTFYPRDKSPRERRDG